MKYPEAIWQPGPTWKVWSEDNAIAGVIEHSMEGEDEGAWSVLNGDTQASWHFSVMYDGAVFQHYGLSSTPWHAGSKAQNIRLIGVEHEGRKGEPLTPAQLKASVALTRWIARQGGWRMERGKTLFEHREVSNTTCPNGRIPWEYYTEEDDVEVIKFVNLDEINAVKDAMRATVDDGVQFVGQIVAGYNVPAGYKAIIAVVKE